MRSVINRIMRRQIQAAICLCAGWAIYSPVLAQDSQEDAIEEITVTGSNIKRSNYSEKVPLQSFDNSSADIARVNTISDFVATLTVNSGSTLYSVGRRAADNIGSAQFNLRNLGAGSTLVLINGRRAGKAPLADDLGNQFYDLNQLPLSMVERLEVQTDGASSIYGSEAVAGVVNVITRKNFEGVELSLKNEWAENSSESYSIAAGTQSDRGRFAIYGSHFRSEMRTNSEIDWLVSRLHDPDGDGVIDASTSLFDSSSGSPDEYSSIVADPVNGGYIIGPKIVDPDCAATGGIVSGNSCRYIFIDQSSPIPEEERYAGFAEFDYELFDDIGGLEAVSVFGELSFARNSAKRAIGPQSSGNGPANGKYIIPGDHPFNFFVDDGTGTGGITYIDPSIWDNAIHTGVDVTTSGSLRPVGLPLAGRNAPELAELTNQSQRIMLGLELSTGGWDISMWGQKYWHENTRTEPGNWIASALQQALTDGAFNPFGVAIADPGLVSPKDGISTAGHNFDFILSRLAHTEMRRRESTQETWDLLVSNGDLFDMPGGPAGLAFGYQKRKGTFEFRPDEVDSFGLGSNPTAVPVPIVTGETDIDSLYVEVALPIIEAIEIQAAVRYEDHGDLVGSTTDPKLAVRWDINDYVGLRASFGTSFQAPSPLQAGGIVGSTAINFPTDAATGQVACGGTAEEVFTVATVAKVLGGLAPQSAENINFGVVFRNEWNDHAIDLSADYWRFDYDDLIVNVQDAQEVSDRDCDDGTLNDPNVVRASDGTPVLVSTALQNADNAVTSGIDLNGKYTYGSDIGTWGAQLSYSLVQKFDVTTNGVTFDAAGSRNFTSGSFGSLPEHRLNLTGSWQNDNHEAFVSVRYVSSLENDESAAQTNTVDSWTTLDAQYRYYLHDFLGGNSWVSVGSNNLLDEEPPPIGTRRPGYDSQTHDIRGRSVYVSVTVGL